MSKLAILAICATLAITRPAHAACRGMDPCPAIITGAAVVLGVGLVGGYVGATGTFVYRDLHDDDQDKAYGGIEMSANAALAALFWGGAVASAKDGSSGSTLVAGGLATLHTTLAIHGAARVYEHRDEIQAPHNSLLWVGGFAYASNTLLWASQAGEDHGRGYGVAEAAVNGPIALGLGYLAYDRASNWHGGSAAVYGGLAIVSGALTVHGLRTAISPPHHDGGLDLLDITPTVVDDGSELAPGLGASGTW